MVVTEASVLVNFLRIDRMDLIAGHSHAFIVTDHVADEVSDRYPHQQLHAPDPGAERDVLIAASAIVHGMTVVTGNLPSGPDGAGLDISARSRPAPRPRR